MLDMDLNSSPLSDTAGKVLEYCKDLRELQRAVPSGRPRMLVADKMVIEAESWKGCAARVYGDGAKEQCDGVRVYDEEKAYDEARVCDVEGQNVYCALQKHEANVSETMVQHDDFVPARRSVHDNWRTRRRRRRRMMRKKRARRTRLRRMRWKRKVVATFVEDSSSKYNKLANQLCTD